MFSSGSLPDPLGHLAEDFLKRVRRGEQPALAEYTAAHPELAQRIQEVFPALLMMEDIRPGPKTVVGPAADTSVAGLPQRLGEYRIVREIGRGGMGIVYEADQESLGRRVALKVLPPAATSYPKQVERFQREARTAARLHHTNIVPVFGVGEEGGTHFLVMQYIEGRPLDEVLAELHRLRDTGGPRAGAAPDREPSAPDPVASSEDVARSLWNGRFRAAGAQSPPEQGGPDQPTWREGPPVLTLPKPEPSRPVPAAAPSSGLLSDPHRQCVRSVAHIGVQAADALEYAAGQGVLHRDVKPANLLLDVFGTVWLTDFGLAKVSNTPDLTHPGDVVGTLHYMAPERFKGRADVRSDVYGLGLTLYELLALRPAYDGRDQAELTRQIMLAEPPRLDRLDPRLPRDLVTIVHKAMAKEPADRYPTAGALADDLRRFLDDRSILGRRVSLPEQAWRWCRRNPAGAGLVAALLALLLLATGGGMWLVRQQAERKYEALRQVETLRKEVEAARTQAEIFRDGLHFREGRERLLQTRQLLEAAGPDDLRRQLDQAVADVDLAEKLDAARLQAATNVEGRFDFAEAEQRYAAAFAQAGLAPELGDAEAMAARVRTSGVRGALVAALDDWAVSAADKGRQEWLLAVARRADPDPWRDRVRDPAVWRSAAALAELAGTAPVSEQPVPMLLALGDRMGVTGREATVFYRWVQRAHPDDFWANLALGNALKYREPGEAIAYYRVALAIRPGVAVSYYDLGEVLKIQGWLDEAIDYYQQALRLDPAHIWAHINLGNALKEKGRLDETIDHFRQAVRLDPENALAQVYLGNALKDRGLLEEAGDHFRQGLALDPNGVLPLTGLRAILMRQGRGDEVQAAWQKILVDNPPEYAAWFGYAELCLFLGQEEEYRRACKALLDRFGPTTDRFIAEQTGRTCLLLPVEGDALQKAAALIDRAVAGRRPEDNWAFAYFLFAEGLAEYRRGRLERTTAVLGGDPKLAMQPAGRLVLAMAQHRLGQQAQARRTLAVAVRSFDWCANVADGHDAWISHILRREAEALILPNLPAFLKGEYQPRDNDERLALVGVCQFNGRHRTVAGLYADALAADPKLTADLTVGHRYRAACFAVVAAVGDGSDAEKLEDRERARLRRQALEWLRADLAAWAKTIDRTLVQNTLRHWQQDISFAGVRDKEALAKLPQAEAEDWGRFWSDVADLLQKSGGPK
jgi:serine/threonine-protein kinase